MNKIHQWQYVPVLRLAFFIEYSRYRSTKFAVFEPNDELLVKKVSIYVAVHINNLFRNEPLGSLNPRKAYFVKCDGKSMTQVDIDNGMIMELLTF
jgi:phage tail sheath protein FI